jgi:hypothetical protein
MSPDVPHAEPVCEPLFNHQLPSQGRNTACAVMLLVLNAKGRAPVPVRLTAAGLLVAESLMFKEAVRLPGTTGQKRKVMKQL